jgi:uncharacterized protein (TIGR02271 family)
MATDHHPEVYVMNTQAYRRTVTALFDKRADALKAVEELVRAGIPRTAVRVTPEKDVTASGSTITAYDATRDEKGFWATLADFFMPEDDRYTYAEAMNRGSILVTVTVDGTQADRAEDILEHHGTVNLAAREESWRKTGWSGYPGVAKTADAVTGASATAASTPRDVKAGEQVLPEVEERLRIGKRQVNSGRVKVRSYVIETPVTERVNLHSETVHVERRPANRPVAAGDEAFREKTIEAVATSEEAVIAKEARVTGEVVVKKDAADRTKTVTDTVRSTRVEVEDNRSSGNKSPSGRP